MKYRYVIVGSGLAGLTIAERLANISNEKVLIIEKRNHIGGNVYDSYNEDRILIQNYGPHTFHTSNKEVYEYLSLFTEWRDYQHRVLSCVDGNFIPFPISIETINELYNMHLTADEMLDFIDSKKNKIETIRSSEDVVLSKVGEDIYNKFFKNFTLKQWGISPAKLDKSVISRIPFRTNRDTRYFTDIYQGQPLHGYSAMCMKMCSNPNIKFLLNTDYKEVINDINFETLIYTGPIDYYFNYCYGKLLYRSIRLKFETHDVDSYQPGASVRYPNDYDFTRITEFKKMTGQESRKTTILKEFPCFGEEPFYPYPTQEYKELYAKYKQRADEEKNVIFVGRLAEYKYYDMDDVVERALNVFLQIAEGK